RERIAESKTPHAWCCSAVGHIQPRQNSQTLLVRNRSEEPVTLSLLQIQLADVQRRLMWISGSPLDLAPSMDLLMSWAVTDPAVARLLWVLLLVVATYLIWLFFCCYSWNQSSSPSLERYLAGRWAQKLSAPIRGLEAHYWKPLLSWTLICVALANN
ncbi:hypothetical protein XENOCAPTIV_018745, partial [Xenoophorus captivus]